MPGLMPEHARSRHGVFCVRGMILYLASGGKVRQMLIPTKVPVTTNLGENVPRTDCGLAVSMEVVS
jgi:hypothetical protein